MGRSDWWWIGRNFPRIFRKSWADRWELMVPVFRTLIADRDASFFGDFREVRYWGRNGSGNEASLAATRVQIVGRPDWWWVGRDFPRIFR